MKKILYTVGELASLTHISPKTIRFYDHKGLLKPTAFSEGGYRLYSHETLLTLQRILVFKSLGFSLQEIENMLGNEDELHSYLTLKKDELEKQQDDINKKIQMIHLALNNNKWETLVNLCFDISHEEIIRQQYASTKALQQRINIHSYSTSEVGWFDFVANHMDIKEYDSILEVGCGTGLMWTHLIETLPSYLNITLTDYSDEMLEKSKEVFDSYKDILLEKNISIHFEKLDANTMELNENQYDIIIANHMLYHVSNRNHCLQEISKALKKEGTFYCSTIGEHHMKEFFDILTSFDASIKNPHHSMTSGFLLENALSQLNPYFSDIQRYIHVNDLLVDNSLPFVEYVKSLPGNASFIINSREKEFIDYVDGLIEKEAAIFISKSTGMFVCRKK